MKEEELLRKRAEKKTKQEEMMRDRQDREGERDKQGGETEGKEGACCVFEKGTATGKH